MNKDESKLLNVLKVLAGITIIVVMILFIIAYQIGVEGLKDETNRSTIISGLLSMIGGIAGAFGAYFIAKNQMTKQLDLHFTREHKKMVLEIKINKVQETIKILKEVLEHYEIIKNLNPIYNNEIEKLSKMMKIDVDIDDLHQKVYVDKDFYKNGEILMELKEIYKDLFMYKYFLGENFNVEMELFYNSKIHSFQEKLDYFMALEYFFINGQYANHKVPVNDFGIIWNRNKKIIENEIASVESNLKSQLKELETELIDLIEYNFNDSTN